MKPAIEFDHVTRRFGEENALKLVTFRAPAGKVTALLGPNGAGKSTALRIAMNLLRPDFGSARTLGVDSRMLGPDQLAKIGYVAEGMEMPDWMDVDAFFNWCRPLYPKWDGDIETMLRVRFRVPGRRRISDLSRGERMNAALLAALCYKPELLVLDEPFSGLDPVARDTLISTVLEMSAGEGFAVVVSAHDIAEIERMADHVVLLDRGTVMLDEGADTLLERFRRIEVVLPEGIVRLPLLPHHWLAPSLSGRVLRFIECMTVPEPMETTLADLFPGAGPPDVIPMGLRDILVAISRDVNHPRQRMSLISPKKPIFP